MESASAFGVAPQGQGAPRLPLHWSTVMYRYGYGVCHEGRFAQLDRHPDVRPVIALPSTPKLGMTQSRISLTPKQILFQ
jgi:hypothetical protein